MVKLRNMVKSPQSPLMVVSHKNASAIHEQKSAGKQVRLVGNSQDPNEKLSVTPGIKENKISTVDTYSKSNSTQPGKVSKKRHSAAKRIVEVKRAGRGKISQRRNAKLTTANVLLTDLDSNISSTVIKNNRFKVVKAVNKMAKQKSVILNKVKPPLKKSLNSLGEVSRSNFSVISDIDSHRKGKKKMIGKLPNLYTKKRQPVTSFFVENKNTKKPELFSNVVSVNSSSDFAATVSRKQSFLKKEIQVTSSNSIKTSISSFRFEKTEKKEQDDSKMLKHTETISQNVSYIALKNNASFSKTSTHTETSESNNIPGDKSLKLKKPIVVKDKFTEDQILQPRMIKARNHARHVFQNKQARNKPEKRKAERKSHVKKVGTTTKFSRKQIQLLSKKQLESASAVRNSRPLRSNSEKSPQSYKGHIPHASSIAKKSKYRGVTGKKKTAVVKVSEIAVNNHKRSHKKKLAIKTRPVNILSSSRTLKSLQTGKGKQFASLTQTAKESVVMKKRKLTPKDHLPQNKSLRTIKQYAALLAIEVTPIRSNSEMSQNPVTSSPAIVSSVCKATGRTTPSQAKKKKELKERRSLSLPVLPSGNVSRQSYGDKYTSTPIPAYSPHGTEKSSPLPARKSVTIQRPKKSVIKHAKKNTSKKLAAKMKKLLSDNKIITGLSVSNNKERRIHRKKTNITHAEKQKKLTPDKTTAVLSVNNNKEKLFKKKLMNTTSSAYSAIPLSKQDALSPKQSAKKKNKSLISSVMNVSKPNHFTVEKHFHKQTPEVKVVKLSPPISAVTLNTKSGKLNKSLQNNSINMHPRKNLRSSHHLNKDMKLASTHKQKSVSYVVKKTQRQYQSRQKMKPKSKSDLHRSFNRSLESQMNIPSLDAKVTSSQKSHKASGNSPQAEKQSELLQRKRNVKTNSRVSSTENRKNTSLSNISFSARSVAESVSQMTNVIDTAFPSSIKKEVKRITTIRKKTLRPSEVKRISAIEKKTPRLSDIKKVSTIGKKTLRLSEVKRSSAIEKKTPRLSDIKKVSAIGKKTLRLSEVKRISEIEKKTPRLSDIKKVSVIGKITPRLSEVKNISAIGKKTTRLSEVKNVSALEKKTTRLSEVKRISEIGKKTLRLSDIKKVSATGKTTPRLPGSDKKRKPVTNARNVKSLSHSHTEDNLELIKDVPISQAKNSKKCPSSVHYKSPKVFPRKEKSLISLRKRGSVCPSKVVKKPALFRIGKRESLPAISVKYEANNNKDSKIHHAYSAGKKNATKYEVSNNYSNTNTQLGVETKARKPSSPAKQNTATARTTVDAKVNLSYPEQKRAFKVGSRQKVTEASSSELQNLRLPKKKTSKLTEIKTLSPKKSVKLPTKTDKRTSLTRIACSVKSAEVQGNTMAIPKQTEPSKPVILINEVQQTIFSPQQKKIFTHSKKKVTKAVHSKIFVNEKRPKLLSEGGIKKCKQNRKRLDLGSVVKTEMMNWLTPRQNKTYFLANVGLLPRTLSKQVEAAKLIVPSARVTRLNKGKNIERISLVSAGQKKAQEAPSYGGYEIPRTKSSTSAKEKGKKSFNKSTISGKKLSVKVCSGKVNKRRFNLSLPKIKGADKAIESDNINLVLPMQNEESELLVSGYKKQKNKSSAQKETGGKKTPKTVSGKTVSKKRRPKLSVTRQFVTSSPNISRSIKAKVIRIISSEQAEEPQSLPGRDKMQKSKILSPSEKVGKKKKTINETSKLLSSKESPNISARVKRSKSVSVSVSPKITRQRKSKDLKKFVSASLGDLKALKPSPRGHQTQKTKLSAILKEMEKKTVKVKLLKEIPSKIHPSEANSKVFVKMGSHISSPATGKNNNGRTNLRNSSVPQGQKSLGLSKKGRSKLSTKTPVTSSPNISRSAKAKQINVISSEQTEESHPLPGRDKTQKTKIMTPSKKVGKKKKTVNETSELISNKGSPKSSTRLKRSKSVSVSPKMIRVGRSKDMKKLVSTSPGSKKALKWPPRGYEARERNFSALQKETEKKKTVKVKSGRQNLSKIHTDKPNSQFFVEIDATMSSAIKGRGNNLRNALVPQEQKRKSKQLSGRQNNKKYRFTDVSKRASIGTMPSLLVHTRLRSPEGIRNVSFKKTDQVYTLNKSLRKSQQSRNISTVRPFNLTSEHTSNETISPSQLKRTRNTPLMINDMYAKLAQNIRPSVRETAQASPAKLQDNYEGLGRRSLLSSDITDSYYSQQTNRTSVTVPLDAEVARRRKDKISLFPEKARAESYICDVSDTRNDREDQLSVKRTRESPQTSTKSVSYSEKSRQISTSVVSFLSPIDNADDHKKYIAGTPFPVQGKSAVSRVYVDSARNMETISSSQPILSNRRRSAANLRISNPVTTHIVSERNSDEESVADSYTKEGCRVETEEEEKMYINREEKEHKESQESTHTNDVYMEEIGKDDSQSLNQNPHAKQCIIS